MHKSNAAALWQLGDEGICQGTDRSLKSLKLFFFCKFPEGHCNFRAKENVYISVLGTTLASVFSIVR